MLGALNRNPSSCHYGSFDRGYWHYRSHFIPCSRFQEGVLSLAYLCVEPFPGNIYYGDKRLLSWIDAGARYALKWQRPNGSFDEWYPNEHSLVATSFVANALAETVLLLRRHEINLPCEKALVRSLAKAAEWIATKDELLVYNQSAGAACALSAIAAVVQDNLWLEAARRRAAVLVLHQTDEGWWSEYGGPDIGYLSLHIDYLAKYYERTRDEDVGKALERALAFLVQFIHPDCSAGGEYMARNTEYLIPSGFVRLARLGFAGASLPAAAAHRALRLQAGVTPRSLDERYLCYNLYNWLDAGLHWDRDESSADALAERTIDQYFPVAGLRVIARSGWYFVANLRKGGSFRLYVSGKRAVDAGVELAQDPPAISGLAGATPVVHSGSNLFESQYCFGPASEPVLGPISGSLLFLLQSTMGRYSGWQRRLKALLRKHAIQYVSKTGIGGVRRFELDERGLRVVDALAVPEEAIRLGTKSSYTLVPSSKYFSVSDVIETLTPAMTIRREGDKTIIERVFPLVQDADAANPNR